MIFQMKKSNKQEFLGSNKALVIEASLPHNHNWMLKDKYICLIPE